MEFITPEPSLPIPSRAIGSCQNAISCVRVSVNMTAVREETVISTGLLGGGIDLYKIGDTVPCKKLSKTSIGDT